MEELSPKNFDKLEFEREIIEVVRKWYMIPEDVGIQYLNINIELNSLPEIRVKLVRP